MNHHIPRVGLILAVVSISVSMSVAFMSHAVSAQQFNLSPANPVLLGEPVAISLTNLPTNQDVKIVAERVMTEWKSDKRALYRADASFAVGADGTLDLARAIPKSGSYKRADSRGLFWSMKPVAGEVRPDRKLLEVRLQARGLTDDKLIAETTITFLNERPSIKTEPVAKFSGALFAIQHDAGDVKIKRPAVILLGGSEGGSMVTKEAARLASYGFAVLALPYYSPPEWPSQKAELPTLPAAFADIPVDRLNEARAWLQSRENINAEVDAKKLPFTAPQKALNLRCSRVCIYRG